VRAVRQIGAVDRSLLHSRMVIMRFALHEVCAARRGQLPLPASRRPGPGSHSDATHRPNFQCHRGPAYARPRARCGPDLEQFAARDSKSSISGGGDVARRIRKAAAGRLPAQQACAHVGPVGQPSRNEGTG
jgi:hypothetical protein